MPPNNDLLAQLDFIKANYLKSVASYSGLCTHGQPISNHYCETCGLAVLKQQLKAIRTYYETDLLPFEENIRNFNQKIGNSADPDMHEVRSLARQDAMKLRVEWLDLLSNEKIKFSETWCPSGEGQREMERLFLAASQVASKFDV